MLSVRSGISREQPHTCRALTNHNYDSDKWHSELRTLSDA